MLKHAITTALLAASLTGAVATGALADEAADDSWGSFGGSVAFTTDYRFRGISQTKGDPALQAGATYTSPWGLYATAWASNIKDFGTTGLDTNLEVDLGVGYANSVGAFTYDIGWVYYLYPGANDNDTGFAELDYQEIYGKFGYDFGIASVLASVYGSPNYTGNTGGAVYYNGFATVPLPFLPWDAALSGGAGYSTFLDDTKKGVLEDYWDYSIGFGVTVPKIEVGLDFRYIDTNLDEDSYCGVNTCDGQFVFTVSKAF